MDRHLQKLHWLKVKEVVPDQIDTVILPVGTVEPHGTACIGTDIVIPETIANGIAERINALVAPTISYGITRSLYRYPGGMTVSPDAFGGYVRDVLASLAKLGFHNLIVMNGHGGNNSVLKDVAFEFHATLGHNIAVIHWWELCDPLDRKFWGHPGGHAGTNECAIVQAVDPAYLDQAAYNKEMAWWFRPGADIYPVPGTILLYEENTGYPEFDVEKARQYREAVIKEVGDFAEQVLKRWRRFGL
ncbi:MAG: creatininase family protein [candidate division Zixibacteria bacterium]|nr:creatininase family protein [candidate division Zixibacteria bacterium]